MRSLQRKERLDKVDVLEDHKMRRLTNIMRCGRKSGSSSLLLVGL